MAYTPWHQSAGMRHGWPNFRSIRISNSSATWRGDLRPLSQSYRVEVTIWRSSARQPHVTVIDPILRTRPGSPVEAIPHHYANPRCPTRPLLCLYDPAEFLWHCGFPAAATIIPWTVDWLACYEGWLATGEWTGGGRHPPMPRRRNVNPEAASERP